MANSFSTTEGWANYAEQMMVQQGLDPKLQIGQIEKALVRDCRFIAPIEMHTKGKSVDDAMQIFMKECGSPEPEFSFEVCRRPAVLPVSGSRLAAATSLRDFFYSD